MLKLIIHLLSLGFRARTKFSLEKRKLHQAYSRLREQFYHELWHKTALNIGASIKALKGGYFAISRNGQITYVKQSDLNTDRYLSLLILSDKVGTHELLDPLIPYYTPPQYIQFNLNELGKAKAFLADSPHPIVIKPLSSGAGMGITTGVSSKKQLFWAIVKANIYCSTFIAEHQVAKNSYRLLFYKQKLIQVVRRDPPRVTGDGQSTIKQLVNEENKCRLHQLPMTAMSPLEIDLDAKLYLRSQGLGPDSIIEKGKSIVIKKVVNQNSARENHLESTTCHPSVTQLGCDIAKILDLTVFGLDILADNLLEDLKQTGAIITDINSYPGLHHHYLVSNFDDSTSVAAAILDDQLELLATKQ